MNNEEKILSMLESLSTAFTHMQGEISEIRRDNAVVERDLGKLITDRVLAGIVQEKNDRNQAVNEQSFKRILEGQARLESDVAGLKSDVAGLKDGQARLEEDVASLKSDVTGLKDGQARLEEDVTHIKVMLENETNKNIRVLAEGYGVHTAKLDRLSEMGEQILELKMDTSNLKIATHDLYLKKAAI